MSPFWFFLELWDLWSTGTGSGPGGGGQTSLKLMDGRSLAPWAQGCIHVTFGLPLALSWRTGLGLISGPFRRRFRESFYGSCTDACGRSWSCRVSHPKDVVQELWDLWRRWTGYGPGWGGQTLLIMMDGRSPGELCQPCTHTIFGLTLAPVWGSGFGLISGPFRRRFRNSFWT